MHRALAVLCGLVLATGPAVAHGDNHSAHAGGGLESVALPIALVVGSVLVLGTSVYLDRAGQLDGRWGDFGVLLGIAGLLAGVALGLI